VRLLLCFEGEVIARYASPAGVVVLAVWGLIALPLFDTARGVVARANESRRKGDTA